jgi:hypothetical protein
LGIVITTVYVDDCNVVGNRSAVDKCITDIEGEFSIKKLGPIKEYVGAKYLRTDQGYTIHQGALIDSIKKVFGLYKDQHTPAAPGTILLKSEENLLGKDDMTKYRSGVGKLLYLVKLSRPDLSSSVRELSKFMDGACEEHSEAMTRLMGYVQATESYGLRLEPDSKFRNSIIGYSDSNFASDKDTRRSVTGFAIYYSGCLVAWKSKMQQCVTLSSTEAEYVACSQCANDMEFVRQILESVKERVDLPMVLYVDNTGAIDLVKNYSTTGRTKHIDIRFHYIRELVDQGLLRVEFVRTDNNIADIFTKNLSKESFEKHQRSLGLVNSRSYKEGVKYPP